LWCHYLPTERNEVLLGKLTGFKLVKWFPTFYGTRRFITTFTSARNLSYPEPARTIPCTQIPLHEDPFPTIYAWVLQVVSPLGFQTWYTPFHSPIRATFPPSHSSRYGHFWTRCWYPVSVQRDEWQLEAIMYYDVMVLKQESKNNVGFDQQLQTTTRKNPLYDVYFPNHIST